MRRRTRTNDKTGEQCVLQLYAVILMKIRLSIQAGGSCYQDIHR